MNTEQLKDWHRTQAATAGEGIAFGWRHVIDRLGEQGVSAVRKDWT